MNIFNKLKGNSAVKKKLVSEESLVSSPEEFKQQFNQLIDETFKSLNATWIQAGYQDAEKQNLINNFYKTLQNTCLNEVQAENAILEHSKKEVENKINEYVSLSHDLGRNQINIENITQTIHNKKTTTDQLSEISKLLDTISIEIESRSKILEAEYDCIQGLQIDLGDQDNVINDLTTVDTDCVTVILPLSDVRLQQLKKLKLSLESIKIERIEQMKTFMTDIHQLYVDMNILEELDHKNQIVLKHAHDIEMYGTNHLLKNASSVNTTTTTTATNSLSIHSNNSSKSHSLASTGSTTCSSNNNNNLWEFGAHIDTLNSLEKERTQLLQEKETRRSDLAVSGAEIARLWTLLRIPSSDREAFSKSFKMNLSLDTLRKGSDELKRLQAIRAVSLSNIVTMIRNDITALWDELGVTSQVERMTEFPGYFAALNLLEDSAVEDHDQYYQKIKLKVEKLRPLLAKIARRELVVQDRIDLEHLQLNPERLTARGPNAKEDRKREENMTNRVKNLEKLTAEILQSVKLWEESHGPLMYLGGRYVDRVIEQEESYESTRDQLRAARKKKDGKLVLDISTAAVGGITPAKTPLSSRKNATIMNASSVLQQGLASPAPLNSSASCSGKTINTTCTAVLNTPVQSQSQSQQYKQLHQYHIPTSTTQSQPHQYMSQAVPLPVSTTPAKIIVSPLNDTSDDDNDEEEEQNDENNDYRQKGYSNHNNQNRHHHHHSSKNTVNGVQGRNYNSTGSDETEMTELTECTSATEVKEMASVCTVKKVGGGGAQMKNNQQPQRYL